ncbi:unnamed protein product [Notodromas monacha]|uniref:RRM domain-containing protein n=1 Tax=Notodromas monacha TaxID=399045 RepID=A0A7R9BL68_9CRUS|nr:unnamed protein product [Notodromas monacha]CAG0917248.1 unnamed protein product [Notodromas monacha]
MSRRDSEVSCKVYVGNLTRNASEFEIEEAFAKYGPLKNVWVARNPPGFAFVEFNDPRDAEDACRGLDDTHAQLASANGSVLQVPSVSKKLYACAERGYAWRCPPGRHGGAADASAAVAVEGTVIVTAAAVVVVAADAEAPCTDATNVPGLVRQGEPRDQCRGRDLLPREGMTRDDLVRRMKGAELMIDATKEESRMRMQEDLIDFFA